MLLGLLEEEFRLADHLLALLQSLLDLIGLLEHADVVAICKLVLLLAEELGAHVRLLIQLFGFELNVDEVCILEEARELVKFLLL